MSENTGGAEVDDGFTEGQVIFADGGWFERSERPGCWYIFGDDCLIGADRIAKPWTLVPPPPAEPEDVPVTLTLTTSSAVVVDTLRAVVDVVVPVAQGVCQVVVAAADAKAGPAAMRAAMRRRRRSPGR